MPLLINLRHLEHADVSLAGELSPEELGLEQIDELVHTPRPLTYQVEAQRLDKNLLVHGQLHLPLELECARCLKRFLHELDFPNWALHLELEGEDKAEIVSDCVDLTPYIREDILLALPQHPLCKVNCGGLKTRRSTRAKSSTGIDQTDQTSSAWAELDKLKL